MEKTESAIDTARRVLAAGDEAGAIAFVEAALKGGVPAEEAVALRGIAARGARALADLALEVAHLEAAEELAATKAPGALGGARLQLGLALLRRGDAARAAKVLAD